jgi:F-type H+-transporting ATPase subunit delta
VSIELVATEYAEGLLSLAIKKEAAEVWMEEFLEVRKIFMENPRLRLFYESPVFGREEIKQVITRIFQDRISPDLLNMLLFLVDKRRQAIVCEMALVFEKLAHRIKREVEIRIETPAPLEAAEEERVKKTISAALGRPVYVISSKVKPEMIGGIVFEYEGQRLDGSIRCQIERLSHELRERCPATAFSVVEGE